MIEVQQAAEPRAAPHSAVLIRRFLRSHEQYIPQVLVVPFAMVVVSERQNGGKACNAGRLSAREGELYRRNRASIRFWDRRFDAELGPRALGALSSASTGQSSSAPGVGKLDPGCPISRPRTARPNWAV